MTQDFDPECESISESKEKQLCLSCLSPNEPTAHFCAKCGAPLSSYAATGPFESLLAEGHVYRSAAERPRNGIVVIGMWLIFGTVGLVGGITLARDAEVGSSLTGAVMLLVAVALLWRTTWNYFMRSAVKVSSSIHSEER